MTTIRSSRWSSGVLLMAVLMALTLAAPAAAGVLPDPPDTSSGKVGTHRLNDTTESPGATCRYPDTPNHVNRIHVEPPVAKARSGRTSQLISFRYVVKGWTGIILENVQVSSYQYRTATPTSKAQFTGRTVAIDDLGDPHGLYLVRVDLRWHSSSGKVVGRASMWVQHYRIRWENHADDVWDFCGNTTG